MTFDVEGASSLTENRDLAGPVVSTQIVAVSLPT